MENLRFKILEEFYNSVEVNDAISKMHPVELQEDLKGELFLILAELPEEFRMAVYLADVEGFSYKEIAEIVGIPSGTVMSRLHRGRKQLREKLTDYARERGYVKGGAK